jgi:hypothetical protein
MVGLADSFGIWGGPESSYHRLLENRLRQDHGPAVELLNLSIDGYEPAHQLNILRFGMRYAPDLVLHGFFVGNDFTLAADDIYKFGGLRVHRPRQHGYWPREFLLRGWVQTALEISAEKRKLDRDLAAGATPGTFSEATFLNMQQYRFRQWATRTEENVRKMREVFGVLDAIRAVATEGGARYVMVIHPDQTQVDPQLRRQLMEHYDLREDQLTVDLPQQLLREYCADRGIACLDLLPLFERTGPPEDLYMTRDTHYSLAGRQLAAAAIQEFLETHQVLPRPLVSGKTASAE